MPKEYRAIVFLGLPGTGKGTQGAAIGFLPGFHFFEAGEMFRTLDPRSEVGRQVRRRMRNGELVPDDLVLSLWKQTIDDRVASGEYRPEDELVILDGLPRTVEQGRMLDEHVDVRKVLHLASRDPQELIDRLRHRARQQGREDDADEHIIRRRLDVYRSDTQPVLDFYPRERVAEIDALRPPLRVLDQILHVLIPLDEGESGMETRWSNHPRPLREPASTEG